MGTTAAEATNFFWHCHVAVKLIDELPETTATKGHALRAVRMATLCAAGSNGVQYASDKARMKREAHGKPWGKCGLIKEHVIPASLVRTLVLEELKATRDPELVAFSLVDSNENANWLTPEVIAQFRQYPRAWQAAKIIRDWTLLAWVTDHEHKELDGRGLGERMPTGWAPGQDRFARYTNCNIAVSRI